MGFYGQIRYQFDKIFKGFKVKNSGKEDKTFVETPSEKELSPFQLRQVLNLDSGNKWIVLDGDQEKSEIKIYHSEGFSGSAIGFEKENTPIEGSTQLEYGDGFSTTVAEIDEAGHIIGLVKRHYILPKSILESELTNRVEALEDFDENFTGDLAPSQISNRLVNLEEFQNNQEDIFVSQKAYNEFIANSFTPVETAVQKDLATKNELLATKEEFGAKDDIDETGSFLFTSVTKALGPLDSFSGQEGIIEDIIDKTNKINEVTDGRYTFAKAIGILGDTVYFILGEIEAIENRIDVAYSLVNSHDTKISDLEAKIEALSKRNEILEEKTNLEESV